MTRQVKYLCFCVMFSLAILVCGTVSVFASLNGTAYNSFSITYEAEPGVFLGDAATFKNGISDLTSVTQIVFGLKSNYSSAVAGATSVVDVSDEQDQTIKRYTVGSTLYVLSETNIDIFANENSASLFSGFSNLTSISFNSTFDTQHAVQMENMFNGCSSLSSIDLTDFDTRNVVSMNSMFEGCSSATSINVSSFNTTNVLSMDSMFKNCSSVVELDLSNFYTTNDPTVSQFFENTSSLDQIITPESLTGSTSFNVNLPGAKFYEVSGTTTLSQTAVTAISSSTCQTSKTLRRGYTVTFDSNGGTSISTGNYTYGETFPINLTRTGYTFAGWYSTEIDNNGNGTQYTTCPDKGNSSSTLTVYARWLSKGYSVVKTLSEGVESCTVAGSGNFGVALPISWTGVEGYKLTNVIIYGRPTANSSAGEVVLSTITSGTSTSFTMTGTYYPQIRIEVNYEVDVVYYTITYDRQGGTTGTTSGRAYYGGDMPKIINPTRPGYIFAGYTNSTTTVLTPDRIGWNSTYSNFRIEYNIRDVSAGDVLSLSILTSGQPTKVMFNNTELTSSEWTCTNVGASGWVSVIEFTVTSSHLSGLLALWRSLEMSGDGVTSSMDWFVYTNMKNTKLYYTEDGPIKQMDVESDLTLYANWIPNIYYVQYNANGGSGTMSNSSCTYDVSFNLTANAFTRTGYTFTGWNTQANGSGTSYSDGQSVSNLTTNYAYTVNLYAQWSVNTYTVTLDNQGATTAGTTAYYYKYGIATPSYYYTDYACTHALGANGYTITCPTKTGYDFAGYYTGTNGAGTQYVDSTGKCINNIYSNVADNSTLYAKWNPHHYTIAYDGNGATGGSTASSSHTYGTASATTTNGFVRTDHTFIGWNTESDGSGTTIANGGTVSTLTPIDGKTVTLYAMWELTVYTVTLDSNAGRGNLPWIGDGDYAGNNMTIHYNSSTNEYTLTISSTSDPYVTIEDTIYLQAGSEYIAHATICDTSGNPLSSGSIQLFYAIGGVYTEAQSVRFSPTQTMVTFTVSATGNYRLRLDNDCGQNIIIKDFNILKKYTSSIQVNYQHAYGTLPTPERNGYTFAGWWTAKTGGTQVTSSTIYQLQTDQTLYAHWTANTYTVTFNANGGNCSTGTKQVTFDTAYGTLPTATKANDTHYTNYVLDGWFTAAEGGTQVTASTIYDTNGNVTLYAHYTGTPVSYTISISGSVYVQGGDDCSSYTLTSGSSSSTSSLTVGYGTTVTLKVGAHGYWGWGTYVNISASGDCDYTHGSSEGNLSTWKSTGSTSSRLVSKSTAYGWCYGYITIVVKGNVTVSVSAGRA